MAEVKTKQETCLRIVKNLTGGAALPTGVTEHSTSPPALIEFPNKEYYEPTKLGGFKFKFKVL